jgi:hypothetical protein
MKKLFTILALLAFLVVPAASMAMVQTSDADLAAITGQSGVDIDITGVNLALGLGTLTWGDYDGFGGGIANAGYINVAFYQAPMHIGVGEVKIAIDVDYNNKIAGKTAIVLGIQVPGAITIDAIIADVVLDKNNGAMIDYAAAGNSANYYYGLTDAQAVVINSGAGSATLGALNTSTLGVFGISLVNVKLAGSMQVVISAH